MNTTLEKYVSTISHHKPCPKNHSLTSQNQFGISWRKLTTDVDKVHTNFFQPIITHQREALNRVVKHLHLSKKIISFVRPHWSRVDEKMPFWGGIGKSG